MRFVRAATALSPRARLALGGGAVALVVATFAACGACGKRVPEGEAPIAKQAPTDGGRTVAAAAAVDAAALREPLMWEHARSTEVEDLAALAAHEGSAGLAEAASDPLLRPVAIRAMGYARGWSQVPLLAKIGAGKDDEEAGLALEAVVELAMRPRRAEDAEDAEELREGCKGLLDLARDEKKARTRRVLAVRALRGMPCPPETAGALPRDVDAK